MDTIRRKLGYRLVLKEATIPQSIKPGGTLDLTIRLQNQGFAAMYNPRPVHVVLLAPGHRYPISVPNLDPRRWEPGPDRLVTINLEVPADIPTGTYSLALWLPDSYASLRNKPAYAVRFANAGVWNGLLGMNILTRDLMVSP